MTNTIGDDFYFKVYLTNSDGTLVDLDNLISLKIYAYDSIENTLLATFSRDAGTGLVTLTKETANYYSGYVTDTITATLTGKRIRFKVEAIAPNSNLADAQQKIVRFFLSEPFVAS